MDTKKLNGLFIESNKKTTVREWSKGPKSRSLVSFNIDKLKHGSPLLFRKTDKWVTGQKWNGRIYFFNPGKTITKGNLFDCFIWCENEKEDPISLTQTIQ